MATFLMEAVVLCALFHLAIWVQVRQAPARRVYSYAPAFVERYIELGKIPKKRTRAPWKESGRSGQLRS